jgi:hypothetical protein
MSSLLRKGVDWAGLAAGPAAWAISTQANYAIADAMCGFRFKLVPVLGLLLVLVALGGALLSWRAWRIAGADQEVAGQEGGRPRVFLALSSTIIAVLFAAVIATQGAAGLFLSGCER